MVSGEVEAGLGAIIVGFIVVFVNKLVFRVKTTQLKIDSREAIRDAVGNVCPNCGHRMPLDSKFCNNCGYKME